MRTISNSTYTINYPDKWCFASNAQYIEIKSTTLSGVFDVAISDTDHPRNTINLQIYLLNGTGKIDISSVFRSMLYDSIDSRCKYVNVAFGKRNAHVLSFHCYVLRGSIELGEYFSSFGHYYYDTSKAYFKHRVVWFKEYPFDVTLFRRSASEGITYTIDHGTVQNIVRNEINYVDIRLNDIAPSAHTNVVFSHNKSGSTLAVFDNTFDHTFVENYGGMLTEVVEVVIKPYQEGYYLRWIDPMGQLRYYLFNKNTVDIELHNSKYLIPEYNEYSSRPMTCEVSNKYTACALNLPQDILAYVKTISCSPFVELYDAGKWIPITVESRSIARDERVLNDYEITFSIKNKIQFIH